MAIRGDAGADRLRGTDARNAIAGLGGDDHISGGEGRDRLAGGDGDDRIFGFGGSDRSAGSADIVVRRAGDGFVRPLFATSAPGDPDRLYVVEQHSGRIMILDPRSRETVPTPFLELSGLATGNEQGLLGMAFHPDYDRSGRFFVYLTTLDGDVEVRGYQRSDGDPDRADAGSGDLILTIEKDNGASNHNGGWLGFGPDGMLHVAVGDEGGVGDPANNAQNRGELWGKMLRIDVDADDFTGDPTRDYAIPEGNPFVGVAGRDEIWALGLRNPWRASFDRETGDLYIGDVGQGSREEIDFQSAGSGGGLNFGWKVKEGDRVFDDGVPGNPRPGSAALTDPVATYRHDAAGGFAVVGGYVHRGDSPGLQGHYLYADFVSNRLWSLRMDGERAVDVIDRSGQLSGGGFSGVTSFAEDGRGTLYAVGIGGVVWRLAFSAGSGDAGDTIDGGAGDDRLYGGAGDDRIDGGPGRDRLVGGAGHDRLTGGRGADTFIFRSDFGPRHYSGLPRRRRCDPDRRRSGVEVGCPVPSIGGRRRCGGAVRRRSGAASAGCRPQVADRRPADLKRFQHCPRLDL